MSPFILFTLLFALGLGTMITFTSTHWLLAWMGLEINTLAIIPLMAKDYHPRAVEAATKYFLTQATAAAMVLFASTSHAWITGQWEISHLSHPLPMTLITLALALKIGLAPLHAWMPEVLQGLNLTTGLILSTWQKLAPFCLILQLSSTNQNLFVFLGLTSMLVGGWGGLNQTQLRKILAYSSIAHLGWMILVLQFSSLITLMTLALYIVMTSSLFMTFKINNTTTVNSLSSSWAKMPALTSILPFILLSLGGLPPLTGFMPKWMILTELSKQGVGFTMTLAALSALLSLYFYLRLSYAMTLTMSPNNLTGSLSWRLLPKYPTLPLATLASFTIWLLPLTPSMMVVFTP
uniref:NADH-ubiquinone oxidoreductase chain 2 n=1 Tax=Fluviphylax simplex TaxID=1517970 RepID=A0A068LAT3_9TELE|nr:NADH dehydrogenase subunit 2 [Fluviphylax simplex]